ncbi:MAG: hypothetical protein IPH07_32785 [Deltaproteobacteria bacterium]|nr:hypothetical protein [Deltaproteobacteria bacterium]MBK8716728.1 hypothetical protein [Deltaproteobacteria bacterium]MBP7285305.1 hypothetical protein [Nannocystaceae bacterium]
MLRACGGVLAAVAGTMTNRGPVWSRLRFALAALLIACDETGSDDDDPYAVEAIAASASNESFEGGVDVELAVGDTNSTTLPARLGWITNCNTNCKGPTPC